ncbi:class I SAM-dependent methyltransferase [Rhodospirillales bacterium]|nr:class I SAM-dependent methyltransferase [Rhodospirillales bacterium]
MNKKTSHINAYGQAAGELDNFTEMSGRYAVQENAERNIVPEIIQKLKLVPSDDLLEIGCGVGNLLIPLSFHSATCTGIDHINLIETLNQRYKSYNLNLIGEDFLNTALDMQFDKILIYSVILLMPDKPMLYQFIDKALDLLKPTGRLLLGDLNNIDLKNRFLASDKGRAFQVEWKKQVARHSEGGGPKTSGATLEFDDQVLMELLLYIRSKGFNSFLVEQNESLPFGHTREDIIVSGPEA